MPGDGGMGTEAEIMWDPKTKDKERPGRGTEAEEEKTERHMETEGQAGKADIPGASQIRGGRAT